MRKLKKIITAAALAAAMLAGAPRTAAACPYTPGPRAATLSPLKCWGCTPTATACKSGAPTRATVATGFYRRCKNRSADL